MGRSYTAKLAFGYSQEQVISGPSMWQLSSWFEDGDYSPSELAEEGVSLAAVSQILEAVKGVTFLEVSSDAEIIMTLDECHFATSIYAEELISDQSLLVKPEWIIKLDKVLTLLNVVVVGGPSWRLTGRQH
jgi:hypothetical protein